MQSHSGGQEKKYEPWKYFPSNLFIRFIGFHKNHLGAVQGYFLEAAVCQAHNIMIVSQIVYNLYKLINN